jgi:hypothetical protein
MTIRKTVLSLASCALIALVALESVAEGPRNLLLKPTPYPHLPTFGFSSFNIRGVGERVTSVRYNSRAARLGLEPGDLIVKLNGYRLTYHGSWNDALYEAVANGGRARLLIRDVRTGHFVTRDVFVGGYPGPVTHKHKVNNGPFPPHAEHFPHEVDYPTGPVTPKSKFGRPTDETHKHETSETLKEIVRLLN